MEDAMVISKSSIERGFAHGAIYASEVNIHSSGLFFILFVISLQLIDLQELVTDRVDQGKHPLVFGK